MKDSKLGMTFASSAVAGGIAGGLTRLVTAPLDVIKIRFQLQQSERPRYLSMCGAFRSIVRTEGLLALWHGYGRPATIYRGLLCYH
jgi:solute carrier family 25 (mitochondrial thiamine pyrophosphate transporter), member 19